MCVYSCITIIVKNNIEKETLNLRGEEEGGRRGWGKKKGGKYHNIYTLTLKFCKNKSNFDERTSPVTKIHKLLIK